MRIRGLSRLAGISLALVVGMVFTACSSTPKAATTTTTAKSSASVPADLSVKSFNVNFTEMPKLKPLTASGQGPGGRHPSRHHVVDALRRLRRPVPEAGIPDGRVQLV